MGIHPALAHAIFATTNVNNGCVKFVKVMASEIFANLKQIRAGQALAYQAKLIDFKNVRSVKFIFNPFHERVASIRFVKIARSLKVPPTHRPCHRPYPLPTHRLLTNDPRAAPPAAPTQRPSTPDPVFVVIN